VADNLQAKERRVMLRFVTEGGIIGYRVLRLQCLTGCGVKQARDAATAGSDSPAREIDVSPFDLGSGEAAALCLHGLTGTPYEIRPVGEAIARHGMRAVGPTLPGHNATPEALAGVTHGEWLESVRAELHALRAEHERVFVAGLSLGGLLTLALAQDEEIDAIAVIGTPLRLRFLVERIVPLLKGVFPFARKASGSDIRDEPARQRHPSYDVMPLAAVHELLRLQRRVRAGLSRVTAPILVAHGAHDTTAQPGDARVILDEVASGVREFVMLESSAHVVPVDRDGPRLALSVAEFFARRT
jgi:carboxylesterase